MWLSDFSFLKIRASSQHGQCSTCVRHKHLLKKLAHHLRARQEQEAHFWQHLRDQYSDRLIYYRYRSLSRLGDGRTITVIQDGLDQGKVALPRSAWMKSKEFCGWSRPKLHVSLTIVHGFFCLWVISYPNTMKDSNASLETLIHALSILQSKYHIDLKETRLSIHCDNTVREMKNNMVLRWAALQTSSGNVKSISMRLLRCGHSHEDVDQCFGRYAAHLSKLKTAEVPEDFVAATEAFCAKLQRPHEQNNYVVCMRQTRDWSLSFEFIFVPISAFLRMDFRLVSDLLVLGFLGATRSLSLIFSLASQIVLRYVSWKAVPFLSKPRKGFHSGAVPFHLTGIGGPGAPHEFTFNRRGDEDLQGFTIDSKHFGFAPHPLDVVLRTE